MAKLTRSLIESGDEEEHSNVEYFSRIAEEGEIRLYRIMHEAEEKARRAAGQQQSPSPSPPASPFPEDAEDEAELEEEEESQPARGRRVKGALPTRRSPRNPAPAEHRLGMIAPRDLGLGLSCESVAD